MYQPTSWSAILDDGLAKEDLVTILLKPVRSLQYK